MLIKELRDRYLSRTDNYSLRIIKDIPLLVPIYWDIKKRSSILRFNDLGLKIWKLLIRRINFVELSKIIAEEYHVKFEDVLNDAYEFIILLLKMKAIETDVPFDFLDTGEIAKIDSEDFLYQLIKDEFKEKSLPASLTWEVTGCCNLRCLHCYIINERNLLHQTQNELELEEIDRIIQQASESGCIQIIITGGEPFLRKDLKDIILSIKKHGILYSIYTNGTLITKEILDFLEKNPPVAIELSIYGATETVYDSVTRQKGSYRKFRKGLELLLDRHFNLRLKSIAMKQNFHEIEAMKIFSREIGVEFRFDSLIIPAIDGSNAPIKSRLSPKQIVILEMEDKRIIDEIKFLMKKERKKVDFYNCGAGRYEANIDFQGRMSLCSVDRVPYYNLRRGNFKEGWKFVSELREIEYPKDSKCIECEARPICKICPGWLKIEKRPLNGKVRFLCEIAEERLKYF